MHHIDRVLRLFPLWALIFSAIALLAPDYFTPLKEYIVPLLMLVMLGMGLTLNWQNFIAVASRSKVIAVGVLIQYLVMPLAAYLLSLLLSLSPELMVGMVLVGSSAGGTASNVIAYLARGDLALSVSMTLLSTLLAILALPLLTWLYIGQMVHVPVIDMLINLLKLILLPIVIGTSINTFYHQRIKKLTPVFPMFSMAAIVLIIAIVVALNQHNLSAVGLTVVIAVVLHNGIGLLSGYWLIKVLGYDQKTARTVAIEVGMQNSGLSVALAIKYFSAASALPGALFSIWHNLSGSILASYWQKRE